MTEMYLSHSEEETIESGKRFSEQLVSGNVVALFGDLGSGKTRFIKGICHGLGVSEHVASPTFTILNEYEGKKLKIHHFDFYRLGSLSELREVGFDEYIDGDGVCLIEWADRVQELLPVERYDVYMSFADSPDERKIIIQKITGTMK